MTQEAACTQALTAKKGERGMWDVHVRLEGKVDSSCGLGYRLGGQTAAGMIRMKGMKLSIA